MSDSPIKSLTPRSKYLKDSQEIIAVLKGMKSMIEALDGKTVVSFFNKSKYGGKYKLDALPGYHIIRRYIESILSNDEKAERINIHKSVEKYNKRIETFIFPALQKLVDHIKQLEQQERRNIENILGDEEEEDFRYNLNELNGYQELRKYIIPNEPKSLKGGKSKKNRKSKKRICKNSRKNRE
jgi:hypothetical protein